MNKPVVPYYFSSEDSLLNSQRFDQPLEYFPDNVIDGINDFSNPNAGLNPLTTPYLTSPDVTSPSNQPFYEYPYLRFGNTIDSWNLPFSYPSNIMNYNLNSQFIKSMSVGGMVGSMAYQSDVLPLQWPESYPQDLSLPFLPSSNNVVLDTQESNNINISL